MSLSLSLSLSLCLSHCVHASCCHSRSICCISQRLLRVIQVSLITYPISLMRLIIPALSSFRYMHGAQVRHAVEPRFLLRARNCPLFQPANPKMTRSRSSATVPRQSMETIPRSVQFANGGIYISASTRQRGSSARARQTLLLPSLLRLYSSSIFLRLVRLLCRPRVAPVTTLILSR